MRTAYRPLIMQIDEKPACVRDFRDLVVWQRSMTLAKLIYQLTSEFPKDERFGLTSQMRRAAVSVASNIAEGHARATRGEFIQFLGTARGSLAELQTQAALARVLCFGDSIRYAAVDEHLHEVKKMLSALVSVLKKNAAK